MCNKDIPPILLLPKELLKLIIKKVDWKSVYNLKGVSKFFYTFINQNLDSLPKPKMKGLAIKCFRVRNNRPKVEFLLKCENKLISSWNMNFSLYKKFEKIESYFKMMDLSEVDWIQITVLQGIDIFKILNYYFKPGISVYHLKITIEKSPVFESFSIFIQKIKHVFHLELDKLCFCHQEIPRNYTLPMIEKMSMLTIFECDCTNFVNKEMINKLILNNKVLTFMKIFSKCGDFDGEILRIIKKRQISCDGKINSHKNYSIDFPFRYDFNVVEKFMENFSNHDYEMLNSVGFLGYLRGYVAKKRCNRCNLEMFINIKYFEFPELWEKICTAY